MSRKPALALLLILALPLFGGDRPQRNWGRCPAVVALETTEVVHALGDTHGDYDRLVQLLAAGKLIAGVPASPAQATWTGGRSILVVTGDMIDKWDRSLDVIRFMRALVASAAAQGGRVVISTGNHEAEFLDDPSSDKTQEFQKELKAAGIKPKAVADGTDADGIGTFLLCLPFATRVNGWFFSHAGSTKGRTLRQLTADLQDGFDKDGYGAKVLLGNKGLLEARMKPPWWEKDGDKPIESVTRLLGYADALGVRHIVFGHQPGSYTFNDGSKRSKGTMFQNFTGLVFLIDTGMSRGVDYSKGALLRIDRRDGAETATAVFPDGTQKQLWP
ncbi:MAG TPA: metallophosphoesterase [Thermoanaerobaculia bacterium]|nr:metallophosphoesterase [Thermoanaerobaculia bacterium]